MYVSMMVFFGWFVLFVVGMRSDDYLWMVAPAFIGVILIIRQILRAWQIAAITVDDNSYAIYALSFLRLKLLRGGPLTELTAIQWEVRSAKSSTIIHLKVRAGKFGWYWLGVGMSVSELQEIRSALLKALLSHMSPEQSQALQLASPGLETLNET